MEEIILKYSDIMDIDKVDPVRIFDYIYDVVGAENAGVDFIVVTYGFGFKPNENIDVENVGVAHKPKDLIKFII